MKRLCGAALTVTVMLGWMGLSEVKAQLADDFSSGCFATGGWLGDTSHFRFTSSSAIPPAQHPALQLYTTGSGSSCMYRKLPLSQKMEWSAWCKLSFNPSSSNYARMYLLCNAGFPSVTEGCIFMGFGMSGDRAGIYQHIGGQVVTLYTDTVHLYNQSTNIMRFSIRYQQPWWYFSSDSSGGNNFSPVDSFQYNVMADSAVAAIWCQYTSSNAAKFYFDDFYAGPVPEDTIPPVLVTGGVKGEQILELIFSEPLNQQIISTKQYFMSPQIGLPLLVYTDPFNQKIVNILFADPFPDGIPLSIFLNHVTDKSGNLMADTTLPFLWHRALRNEVIISEIMADPSPPVKLPESEYLELHNTSELPVNLCNWILQVDQSQFSLPCITMGPGSYLLLVNENDISMWSGFSSVCAVSKLSLRNDGALLSLQDYAGKIIHAVEFNPAWHTTPQQSEGGYSLEIRDEKNPCDQLNTWRSTLDLLGGTPCRSNSFKESFPDQKPPSLLRIYVADATTIIIDLSEPMDTTGNPSVLFQIKDHPGRINNFILHAPLFQQVELQLACPLSPDTIYTLLLQDTLKDCCGNFLTLGTFPFGIPVLPDSADLVASEVMYMPLDEGTEYLEIFNNSGKLIDLSMCRLAKLDTVNMSIQALYNLTDQPVMIFPGDYMVMTGEIIKLLNSHSQADAGHVFCNAAMPVLPDDGAVYAIITQGGMEIDRFCYDKSFHAPYLSNIKGIALERLSPLLKGSRASAWYSASSASGWATPTLPNSQHLIYGIPEVKMEVKPRCYRPGTGAGSDLVSIRFSGLTSGSQLTLRVFDEAGNHIKYLVNEGVAADEDIWRWDGTQDSGQLPASGIYIIDAAISSGNGSTGRIRVPVVLAR
jgi:hypothetical protein